MALDKAQIREVILEVVQEQEAQLARGSYLQQNLVLNAVAHRLGIEHMPDHHPPVLAVWSDLFRIGYFAWGGDLGNPNPPFFHVTTGGRRALERLSRDPGNPAGYLKHLATGATLNPVSQSYLSEGLECFAFGHYKAAAVMLGGAAESLALEVRDRVVLRAKTMNIPAPKDLGDWKLKTVLAALATFLGSRTKQMPKEIGEGFVAYWPALTHQIRMARNEAGHPVSVDPVTEDSVHASFLLFPGLARLATRLGAWIDTQLQ